MEIHKRSTAIKMMIGKTLFITTFLIIHIGEFAYSQITFQKTFYESPYVYNNQSPAIQQTADGGYIILGKGFDTYLIKTDIYGDTIWTKSYGKGSFGGYSVKQTSDGGYIIIGTTLIAGKKTDLSLTKTNTVGDIQWTKAYGDSMYDYGYSVKQTSDGGYILTGLIRTYIDEFVALIKTDPKGDTLWTKVFGCYGKGSCSGYYVEQTSDGGYIITGSAGNQIYLIRTNPNGKIIWSKSLAEIVLGWGLSVYQTADSGFILAGSILYDICLFKTDKDGIIVWSKYFGGKYYNWGSFARQTSDGGYILLGGVCLNDTGNITRIALIKTNSNGDTLWTKTIGSQGRLNIGTCVQQTLDGGYIVSGYSDGFGQGDEMYIIKTDANGNSGCNQKKKPIYKFSRSIQTVDVGNLVFYPNISVSSLVISAGSGLNINTLCSNISNNVSENPDEITIYPNPAKEYFTLNINIKINNTSVEIFNVLGVNVYSRIMSRRQEIINTQNFSSGIYIVKVNDGKQFYKKRLIVQ